MRSRVELFLEAASEQIETGSKKTRGRAKKSLELIETMKEICAAAQPITGRGVGYKLFTAGLIPSMGRGEMQRVYRLLKEAREQDIIPWEWIVDESRELERVASWDDPEQYTRKPKRSPVHRCSWAMWPRATCSISAITMPGPRIPSAWSS